MSIKIHFTGYRTAHLEIHKWLMYTHIIIQKILEEKKQTSYNGMLKIRFHGSIRVAEGSDDRQCIYLDGLKTCSSDSCSRQIVP